MNTESYAAKLPFNLVRERTAEWHLKVSNYFLMNEWERLDYKFFFVELTKRLCLVVEMHPLLQSTFTHDLSKKIRVGPNPNSWWNQADSLILGWGWFSWTFWAQLQVCSCLRHLAPGLQSFGLAVLEADFLRSEFWLEIKILLCKSTLGNTKIASELKSNVK